jgi:hypothetical protein
MGGVNNPGFDALPKEVQQNILSNMAMGGVQLPYYNINSNGMNKYEMGGVEGNETGVSSTSNMSANKKMTPEEWAKYNKDLGYEVAKNYNSSNTKYATYVNPKDYAYDDSGFGGYKKIGDVGKTTDYTKDPTYKPFNEYNYKAPITKQVISTKKAIPERDPNRPTWNFNSGDNPSFGGVSYTNAAGTGKVVPQTTLKYGGKLPKYADGIKTPTTNSIIMQDNGAPSIVPTSPDGSMANKESYFKLDSNAIGDENNDFQWNFKGGNYTKPDSHTSYGLTPPKRPNGPDEDSFNWKDALEKVGNFAAQNAGNIYNLSRYNKPEVETYERAQAKYLDPTQARKDEQYNYRQSLENVRTGSMGSGATLLANTNAARNRASVNTARINKEYENANAQIGNENNRYNTELAYRETIANAQNRARNRSGKGEAIGDIGEKFGMATKANKQGNMDQNTLELMMKYYNTPEFQKMMKDNKFKK